MLRSILFSFSFFLCITTAFAQDSDPTGTVNREIRTITNSYVPSGFNAIGSTQYFGVNNGDEQTIDVYFNNNTQYEIWGACDGDCGDIDFVLSDIYGNEIDSDVLEDARPVVRANGLNGTYRLTVKMYECSFNPCRVGVVTYGKQNASSATNNIVSAAPAPAPVAVSSTDSHRANVDAQLQNLESSGMPSYYSRFRQNDYRWLNEGETQTFQVQLGSGSYQIWGVCDGDCGDLDMTLYDAAGNKIDEDVLEDAKPLLNPSISASGTYTVSVKMYDCAVEPCLVGINFFSN